MKQYKKFWIGGNKINKKLLIFLFFSSILIPFLSVNAQASDLYGAYSSDSESHTLTTPSFSSNHINRNTEINYEHFDENQNLTENLQTNAYENIIGIIPYFDADFETNTELLNNSNVYPFYNVYECRDNGGSTDNWQLTYDFVSSQTTGYLDFWYLASNAKEQIVIYLYDDISLKLYIRLRSNTISNYNDTDRTDFGFIQNNTWNHLSIQYDCNTDIVSFHLNNNLLGSDRFYSLATSLDNLAIHSDGPGRDYTYYFTGIGSSDLEYTQFDTYYYPLTYNNYYTPYTNLTIDSKFSDRYIPVNSFDNTSYLSSYTTKSDVLNISDYDSTNNEQLGIEYNIQNSEYIEFSTNVLMDVVNEGYNISFWSDSTLLTMFYASSLNMYSYTDFSTPIVGFRQYFYPNLWVNIRVIINCNTNKVVSYYVNQHLVRENYDLFTPTTHINKIQIATQYINVDYSLYISNTRFITSNGSHIVKTIPDYNTGNWFDSKQLHVYGANSLSSKVYLTTQNIFFGDFQTTFMVQLNINSSIFIEFRNTTNMIAKVGFDTQINRLYVKTNQINYYTDFELQSGINYTYKIRFQIAQDGLCRLYVYNQYTETTGYLSGNMKYYDGYTPLHYEIYYNNPTYLFNGSLSAIDSNGYLEYNYNETIIGTNYDTSMHHNRILETYTVNDSSYNNFENNNQFNLWDFSGSYSYSIQNKYMSDNLSNADRPRQKLISSMSITHPNIMNISTNSSDTFTGNNTFVYYGVFDVINCSFIYLSCGIYWINLTIDKCNFESDGVSKYAGGSTSFSTSDTFLDNSNKFCVGVYKDDSDLKFIIRYKYSRYIATYSGISSSDLSKPQFRLNSSTFDCYGLNYGIYPNIFVPNSGWYFPENVKYISTITYSTYITFTPPTLPNPYSGFRNLYNQILSFNTSQLVSNLPNSFYVLYQNFTYVGQNSTWTGLNQTVDGISLFGYYEFNNFTFQFIHNITVLDCSSITYTTNSDFGLTWIFLLEEPNPTIIELAITSLTPLIILLIFPYALGQRFGKTGSIIGLLFGFVVFGISRLISPIYTILLGGISIIILYVYLKNKKEGVNDIE